jgi:hypothetical protein
MEVSQLVNKLIPGKIKARVSLNDIYAIIQPEKLPEGILKNELLSLIVEGKVSEATLLRRPLELW